MNILLVRPNTPRDSINLQSFMICEPLELEYVAAALEQEGHTVELVDMLLEKHRLRYFLRQKNYDMVCFTAYITTVGMVKAYAKEVKTYNPAIKVAVGGVHAEVVPTDFVSEHIDYILWANGVRTLLDIVRAGCSEDAKGLDGIYGAGKTKPAVVGDCGIFPDRNITRKYRHQYNYIYHDKCATIKTSYGCPYHCTFCFCTQVCSYQTRNIESVLDELEQIEEENVFIVDDDFLVSETRLRTFCEGLDRRGIKKHYIAFGRADFIVAHEDVMKLLHAHGFDAFFVGIESFKKEELSDFSKQSTVEQNMAAVRVLEENGMCCYSGLICGEDWTKADFDTLIGYLNTFRHPMVNIQPITPMPGTPLFESYPYPIVVSREDYAKWDMAHVVFQPQNMSRRAFYYHIIRAYLKTAASKSQRVFIRKTYGRNIYRRVRRGATKIFFQYLTLMISGK